MKNKFNKLLFVSFCLVLGINLSAQIGDCGIDLELLGSENNLSSVEAYYKGTNIDANIQITNNSDIEFRSFTSVLLTDGHFVEEGSILYANTNCIVDIPPPPLPIRNMRITPNPTSNNALVEIDLDAATDLQLSLINPFGQVVKMIDNAQQYGIGIHTFTIEMSELPSGIYIVQATDGKRISSRRVVKQ